MPMCPLPFLLALVCGLLEGPTISETEMAWESRIR